MLALDAMVDQDLFICPRCGSPVRPEDGVWHCAGASCAFADEPFPVVSGVPALVDFEASVLDAGRLRAVEGASEVRRSRSAGLLRRLVHPANTTAPANVARMEELLKADTPGRNPRILVIGGGTVGDGLEGLYDDPTVDLISFDVYASAVTQFVGDGHSIPLAEGSVDGVIVQAVLEHVLEPTIVANEIHRVLRIGGIVYADTPFLQQVHEGAYDFTRFTDSGHRFLFRRFERIDSGYGRGRGYGAALVGRLLRPRADPLGVPGPDRVAVLLLAQLPRPVPRPEALGRRSEQRLLPRPQDRGADHGRRHHRLLPGRHVAVGPHSRHLAESGCHVPRRRRLGRAPGRGRRHAGGLCAPSVCTSSTTRAGGAPASANAAHRAAG